MRLNIKMDKYIKLGQIGHGNQSSSIEKVKDLNTNLPFVMKVIKLDLNDSELIKKQISEVLL